jgi:hypothetical protein
MIAKPLLPKCWWRRVIIVTEDVGEAPHAKGVNEGDVGVDVEDVIEAPCAKALAEESC